MKKLLLVTDAWHPQVNGVVTVFDSIIPFLEKRGWIVSVIHPGLFRTIPLPFYPEIRLALFPRRRIQTTLREIQPDAIHLATEGTLGLSAQSVCHSERLSFTTSYHTHFHHYIHIRLNLLSAFAYAFMRWIRRRASKTMVATERLKHELEENGFRNVFVWPLGVDTEFFARNPVSSLPSLPKPVFVFFSRLASEKSPEEFLRLELPGTKLVIGDGPDRAMLEKKYGEKVLFVGYKRGKELVNWLSLSDVCVFPSRTETFGLVVLEALSCGIPVAAHDCQGPGDIITNGVDGYLSEDLEDAARKCLGLDRDACRKKALSYSWERSADIFESLLVPAKRESRSIA